MSGQILGFAGKLYYNTGSHSSPVWVLVDTVGDLDNQMEDDEADATSRAGNGEEWVLGSISKKTIELEVMYDSGNTAWMYLQGAYFARPKTVFEVASMDGPIATTGSQGLRVTVTVMKFGRKEPLKELMKSPVTLRPAPAANPAAWYTAS